MPEPATLPPPILSHDEIRALLAHTALVIGPGETLIIRVGERWTPNQVREYQEFLDTGWAEGDPYLPFRAVIVLGEELAVARSPFGPLSPIAPVPIDDPAGERPQPRAFPYPIGGACTCHSGNDCDD